MTKTRPAEGEYAPYAEKYVSLITGTDILETLEAQLKQTTTCFRAEANATETSAMGLKSGR